MDTAASPVLMVEALNVSFTSETGKLEALEDVSFDLYPQEFLCIIGPSGSGKSSLLRTLAGLVQPESGKITYAPGLAQRRKVALVFQQANLMPWRTAIENITLPLELEGVPREEACRRAQAWIERVGLQGFEQEYPANLSGGMAQRVAIARSLIQQPDLVLLDEPFGSLDALTRERMAAELLTLWQEQRMTVLMVTHSISEAVLLADRVLVFSPRPARICQEVKVNLPRPRHDEMRYTPEFSALARQLRAAISEPNW